MPEPSILDARLAEIDRRLRMIQSGLEPVPDGEPGSAPASEDAPSDPPPPTVLRPAPEPQDEGDEVVLLTARLAELTAAHERLLAATQDMLIEQADILSRAAPAVSVSAGPFADTAALQEFRSALAGLPQVREATIREYLGTERAVLDVHLRTPIS
jgi:hypothetical protein